MKNTKIFEKQAVPLAFRFRSIKEKRARHAGRERMIHETNTHAVRQVHRCTDMHMTSSQQRTFHGPDVERHRDPVFSRGTLTYQ